MNDDSTGGSSAGGGGMNGMEQSGRVNNDAEAYSEPDYIPLSTKPRQTPSDGGSGSGGMETAEGNENLDGTSDGSAESGSGGSSPASTSDTTGGTA